MPRAIHPTERLQGRNANLLPSTWEALRTLAYQERTTISEQIRRAVDAHLAKRKGKPARKGKRHE